jgi:hypothetical protein
VPSKYHYRVLLGEISVSHSGKYEDDWHGATTQKMAIFRALLIDQGES